MVADERQRLVWLATRAQIFFRRNQRPIFNFQKLVRTNPECAHDQHHRVKLGLPLSKLNPPNGIPTQAGVLSELSLRYFLRLPDTPHVSPEVRGNLIGARLEFLRHQRTMSGALNDPFSVGVSSGV